jgi:basic amino acid/polyamine antiporter, APA family
MDLFRRKSVTALQTEAASDHSLKRALGPLNLTALGIGAIIGTGIFVLTGTVAAQNAGPAVVLSFVFAGIASIFAALCYSEFASLVPMAGSAYTYGYATLGEFVAWIIGWDLVLEYALAATTVAIGWSGYVVSLLNDLGIHIPPHWQAARGTVVTLADGTQVTALLNLPAVFIIALITTLLVVGIRESASVNNVIVFIKVIVVLLFIVLATSHVNPDNWHPFIPPNTGAREHFGFSGVVAGAAIVFFAYIGLYIVVSAIATGVVPYTELDVPAPIAKVADYTGLGFFGAFIKIGAIAGLTSVILVQLLGQSRIFYSMSRDGLLPPFIRRVHPRFRTPYITSVVTGLAVAIPAAILPVRDAAKLVSIGTLLAFVIVCVGVLVLRIREPNLPRPFKTPFVWFVSPAGALSAAYLMYFLDKETWIRLLVWLAIGLAIYFLYSRTHSRLATGQRE